jgi:hypothetical protein
LKLVEISCRQPAEKSHYATFCEAIIISLEHPVPMERLPGGIKGGHIATRINLKAAMCPLILCFTLYH